MTRLGWLLVVTQLLGCGPKELRVTMNSDNNSGQAGFALVTETAGGLRVEVETSHPDVDSAQSAHVHTGTCGEIGPVVLPLERLEALPGTAGRFGSVTTFDRAKLDAFMIDAKFLKLEPLLADAHCINVHDARDPGIYVSCGELHR